MNSTRRLKVICVILLVTGFLLAFSKAIPNTAIVEGRIANVFNDVVPGAKITLGKLTTEADEMGNFSFEDLKPGLYRFKVEANGYEDYIFDFLAEIGRNHVEISEDLGLKPNNFAVDFHVFYALTNYADNQLFAYIGLYNGTKNRLVVERITLIDPNGNIKTELITSELILEKNTLKKLELSGLPSPIPQGLYQLFVSYKEKDEIITNHFFDTAQYDDDWDPHS